MTTHVVIKHTVSNNTSRYLKGHIVDIGMIRVSNRYHDIIYTWFPICIREWQSSWIITLCLPISTDHLVGLWEAYVLILIPTAKSTVTLKT